MDQPLAAIILAAGLGTRMRSDRAKVLHEIAGEPMIARVLRAVASLAPDPLVVVVGHQADLVAAATRVAVKPGALRIALQTEQRGTGHAARCAMAEIPAAFAGDILIGYGDMPRLTPATLRTFIEEHRARDAELSFISVALDDPGAYGRVVRDADGKVAAIVEARDATPAQLEISEINTGIYLVNATLLRAALAELRADNAQHEFYLTDIVAIARGYGRSVFAWCAPDAAEFAGINSREDLALMETQIRDEINRRLMAAGVTLIDPATAYIAPTVEIGRDTIIGPNVQILGHSRIGANVVIEGTAWLSDVAIGDRCHLKICVRADRCCHRRGLRNRPLRQPARGHRSRGSQSHRQFRRDQKSAHRPRHQGQPFELPRRCRHRPRDQRRLWRYHRKLRWLRQASDAHRRPLHGRMRYPIDRAGEARR